MAYPPSVAAEQPANSVWLFPKEQACLGGYYTYMEAPVAGYEEKNISYKCINDQGGRWLLTASSPGKGTLNFIFVWDLQRSDVTAMVHGWADNGNFYLAVPVREKYLPKNKSA